MVMIFHHCWMAWFDCIHSQVMDKNWWWWLWLWWLDGWHSQVMDSLLMMLMIFVIIPGSIQHQWSMASWRISSHGGRRILISTLGRMGIMAGSGRALPNLPPQLVHQETPMNRRDGYLWNWKGMIMVDKLLIMAKGCAIVNHVRCWLLVADAYSESTWLMLEHKHEEKVLLHLYCLLTCVAMFWLIN